MTGVPERHCTDPGTHDPHGWSDESEHVHCPGHKACAATLVQQGARIVRDYNTLHNTETVVLRQLADVIVQLRACYENRDGRADLRGTSQGYRDAVQTLYRKADIPPDAKSTMQAAVRYHINQRLREHMRDSGYTEADFAYYDLDTADQAEKQKRRAREKAARARRAQALESTDEVHGDTEPGPPPRLLRQGHHDPRNLWEYPADQPAESKSGYGVGRIDSAELAAEIVAAVNAWRDPTPEVQRLRARVTELETHLAESVTITPGAKGGQAVIGGTRVPVDIVAGLVPDVGEDNIYLYYPRVTGAGARAAVAFYERYTEAVSGGNILPDHEE